MQVRWVHFFLSNHKKNYALSTLGNTFSEKTSAIVTPTPPNPIFKVRRCLLRMEINKYKQI
jgi:hypothetical protein